MSSHSLVQGSQRRCQVLTGLPREQIVARQAARNLARLGALIRRLLPAQQPHRLAVEAGPPARAGGPGVPRVPED